jgi:hypothetical protein
MLVCLRFSARHTALASVAQGRHVYCLPSGVSTRAENSQGGFRRPHLLQRFMACPVRAACAATCANTDYHSIVQVSACGHHGL